MRTDCDCADPIMCIACNPQVRWLYAHPVEYDRLVAMATPGHRPYITNWSYVEKIVDRRIAQPHALVSPAQPGPPQRHVSLRRLVGYLKRFLIH